VHEEFVARREGARYPLGVVFRAQQSLEDAGIILAVGGVGIRDLSPTALVASIALDANAENLTRRCRPVVARFFLIVFEKAVQESHASSPVY